MCVYLRTLTLKSKVTWRGWFSPSIIGVLGYEFRLSDLVVKNAFTCWSILPIPVDDSFNSESLSLWVHFRRKCSCILLIFYLFICICACMNFCVPCVWRSCWRPEFCIHWNGLKCGCELPLGPGTQTQVFHKSSKAVIPWHSCSCCGDPYKYIIVSLLLHNCSFAAVMNCNVNVRYTRYLRIHRERIVIPKGLHPMSWELLLYRGWYIW